MQLRPALLASFILLAALAFYGGTGEAHQPFFEDWNYTFEQPRLIRDPDISTVFYGTLSDPEDVDYFRFTGKAGQAVAIRMDIPQVKGQEAFAPMIAVLGPGLPKNGVPERVRIPEGAGIQLLEPPEGEPERFYEPFSRTAYWTRQKEQVILPEDGEYWIAVYHPDGQLGHYALSVGEREVIGGDVLFPVKIRRYFRPVPGSSILSQGLGRLAESRYPPIGLRWI